MYNNSKYEIYLGRNLILNFRRKREKEKLKKHRRNEEFKVKSLKKNSLKTIKNAVNSKLAKKRKRNN